MLVFFRKNLRIENITLCVQEIRNAGNSKNRVRCWIFNQSAVFSNPWGHSPSSSLSVLFVSFCEILYSMEAPASSFYAVLFPQLSLLCFRLRPSIWSFSEKYNIRQRLQMQVALRALPGRANSWPMVYTLTTGKSGSIVLLFSNGSTVTLAGNTRFSVSRFFQETHRERADLENLDIEPGRSTTRLKLDYGEIVGHTRRLRTASTYEIETPIGIAGIRGTTYSINVTVEPNTKAFSQLEISVVEGIIGFKGSVATLLELNQLLKEALAGPKPDPVKEWFGDRFREIGAGQRITFELGRDAKTRLPKLEVVEATVDAADSARINMIVQETIILLKKAIQRGAFDEAYR